MALVLTRNELLATEIRTAEPSHALVMLEGELDLSTSPQLYEEFAALARDGIKHVALNLAELKFMDSSGLSAIIAEHKRAEAMGGELIIFSPRAKVRRLFELTGLDEYLNIRPRLRSY
ncbi:MAG TPA: STAS domain-containing protein [Acidimicrobiales bacterium]|jgi:anti-sigma B factor antagonist